MSKINDLTNQRFGRLVVLHQVPKISKYGGARWLCICNCGTYKEVSNVNLSSGNTVSCGCYAKDINRSRRDLYNFGTDTRSQAIRTFFGAYQKAAKRFDRAFDLTIFEFEQLIKQDCYYCGDKYLYSLSVYSQQPRKYIRLRACGLDRIDNAIGYTTTNVVPCCKPCNIAKAAMSKKEFIDWVHRVSDHLRSTKSVD